jgi:hypothetical protein
VGGSVTFSVMATGSGLTYQWRKGGTNIDGATTSSYTNASVGTGDAGLYDVVLSGACGSPATSSPATLTVDPASAGGTATPTAAAVCSGTGTTITLTGQTGNILKWQSSTDGNNWSDIASTANPLPTGTLTQTTEYRVLVQSGVCGTANSSVATVNVNALVAPSLTCALTLNATTIHLTFSGSQGQSYKVLESSNLLRPVSGWNVLTTGTFGVGAVTYDDTNATDAARFYRITSP